MSGGNSIGTLLQIMGKVEVKEGNVREWCRLYKKGRSDVRDEERDGRLSLATDESNTKISGKRPIHN